MSAKEPSSETIPGLLALTKQGEDYIWRPATAAVAELLRLKSLNAELVALVLDDKEGDLDFVQFQVRSLLSRTT